MAFFGRAEELAALKSLWEAPTAQFVAVTGRRRVGKTTLLEHFAQAKRHLYFRCRLVDSGQQLQDLGKALAALAADEYIRANPPATWDGVFGLLERFADAERILVIFDELPYWVSRDESVPSTIQNWWDAKGRHLPITFVICGSALQMMERLLSGDAPLYGCITGQLVVRPLPLADALSMLQIKEPIASIESYCILGGVPLYLSFFQPARTLRENILDAIANPNGRLYVEPHALFASHHASFDAASAFSVLRAVGRDGKTTWSDIAAFARIIPNNLGRVMNPLIDMGVLERELPVTEPRDTRSYHTQYHITDNFLGFWFKFIEPRQGYLEGGDRKTIVDEIIPELPQYLGLPFEAFCRDWARIASARRRLSVRAGRIGTWWAADHQIDIVGLDASGAVCLTGEAKWENGMFDSSDLHRYLGHVSALAAAGGIRIADSHQHLLCVKSGFTDEVVSWARSSNGLLLTPADLIAGLAGASSASQP